jgi:hypothetical protein
MAKKKAKSKTAEKKTAKKTAKKKSTPKSKKEPNPTEVRKNIAIMVESEAETMAQAVIDEGKKGQLAPVKYLFEVAEIYPPSTDGSHATADEDCLAKTLLHRLNIPDEPIARDEEDEPTATTSADKPAAKPAGEDEGKDSGSEPEAGDESKDSMLV